MYRIQAVLVLLALLPLIMAVVFRTTVVPNRRRNMVASLSEAGVPRVGEPDDGDAINLTTKAIDHSISRVEEDFDSLYGTRFFLPAIVLCFFYAVGLSFGTSYLLAGSKCSPILCRPFLCFSPDLLLNPVFAVLGAYVFNTSMIVQRAFIADVTKNVFWASLNRLVFSVGFSLALYSLGSSAHLICFGIAFFPGVFVTWLRKTITKLLGLGASATEELEIQLIQGIDIWKEDRLAEEGIDSVQNLATSDVFSLAVKTHYPLRTIIDWVDQAILIQRFPGKLKALQDACLPISAIDFAWMSRNDTGGALSSLIGTKLGADGLLVGQAMAALAEDMAVRILWRIWQSRDPE